MSFGIPGNVNPDFTNQPQPVPIGVNEPTGYLDFYESTDHIGVLVVAISIATRQAFVLPMVSRFETSKEDGGEPGTFNFEVPLAATQGGDSQHIAGATAARAYARFANPNDIIAIYAQRVVNVENAGPLTVGPANVNGITYGVPGFVDALQDASLLFVGMVGDVTVDVLPSEQPVLGLRVSGTDLTKILLESNSGVPDSAQGAYVSAAGSSAAGVLIRIGGIAPTSGTQIILNALDNIISKNYPPNYGEFGGKNFFADFAYPWRNYISVTKALAYNNGAGYDSFSEATPDSTAYTIQAGSAAQNLVTLRNSPLSRLFIDEYGNLIFDDALGAWTGTSSSGSLIDSPDVFIVTEAEAVSYRFTLNDGDLITYISVWPMGSLLSAANVQTIAALKGTFATPAQTPDSMAGPDHTVAPTVQNYGYRYGTYQSLWDFNVDDTTKRKKAILTWHNNIKFAEVTVRGRPNYHVGARVSVILPAHRPEFTNASWYIVGIQHEFTFGEHWVTHLRLRFPMVNGSLTP